jgi:hypothetical protein
MARYIRLYECPSQEKQGNILGFSSGIANGVRDSELHHWLSERGYTVTPESDEQTKANLNLGGFVVRTAQYHEATGIPLPEKTVSAGHLLVEPPLKDEDLQPLGELLSHLDSIDDGGLRQHLFIDNRTEEPQAYDFNPNNVIAWWG